MPRERMLGRKDILYEAKSVNTVLGGVASGGTNHNILSATHSDAATTGATRGDLIVADATPQWDALAVGSVGQYLRSDGTDPGWSAIQAGDLPSIDHGGLAGLGDDDHDQYLKEKGSGGTAAETPTHAHTGAAEAGQLDHGAALTGLGDDDHSQYAEIANAETISGAWQYNTDPQLNCNLDFIGAARSITNAGGNITVAPTGDIILDPSGADILPGSHRSEKLGSASLWYSEAYIDLLNAGTIKTVVFETDVINVFNGSFMIAKSSAALAAQETFAASGADTFTANETGRYAVNDIVRIKDAGGDTWFTVTGIGSDPIIDVTVSSTTGDRTFPAGTPLVNYGSSGQGLLMFSANDISAGSHTLNAPGMSIFEHAGSPWSSTTEYVRIGNMNGAFGKSADVWGLGVGDYSGGNYLLYDDTGGFILAAGDGAVAMDGSGLTVTASTSKAAERTIKIDYGGNTYGEIYDVYNAAGHTLYFQAQTQSSADSNLFVNCLADTGQEGRLGLYAGEGSDVISLDLYGGGGTSTVSAQLGGGPLFINETANANQTYGLTVNQGQNVDDEILALKSLTDVAHGFTDATYGTETDTFFHVKKSEGDAGGARLVGYKDSGGVAGLAVDVRGWLAENADTTKSTAGLGIVQVLGAQSSGSSPADVVADGNVFTVACRRGAAYPTIFIVDEDGDYHYDGTGAAYDEYDDALMALDLSRVLAGRWDEAIEYNRHALEAARIIGPPDEHGRFMVSGKRLNMLLMGAIGQLYNRVRELEGCG